MSHTTLSKTFKLLKFLNLLNRITAYATKINFIKKKTLPPVNVGHAAFNLVSTYKCIKAKEFYIAILTLSWQ